MYSTKFAPSSSARHSWLQLMGLLCWQCQTRPAQQVTVNVSCAASGQGGSLSLAETNFCCQAGCWSKLCHTPETHQEAGDAAELHSSIPAPTSAAISSSSITKTECTLASAQPGQQQPDRESPHSISLLSPSNSLSACFCHQQVGRKAVAPCKASPQRSSSRRFVSRCNSRRIVSR